VLLRAEGVEVLLDPMANTCIPHALEDVLRNPALAAPKENPDRRYRERSCQLYDTAFWYSRAARYAVRADYRVGVTCWTPNPSRRPQ
jgi:hypothetical protein